MTTPRDVKVERTPLPGIGLRLEISAEADHRVGVIHHADGHVELFISHPGDSDLVKASVQLTGPEISALKELLGGSAFAQELAHLRRAALGIAVDWLPIETGSPFVGRPLGDTRLRTRTGVSVVAVIRDGGVVPSPNPMFEFALGDVVVAVGTTDGLAAAEAILRTGT